MDAIVIDTAHAKTPDVPSHVLLEAGKGPVILMRTNMDKEMTQCLLIVTDEGYLRIRILGRMDRRIAIGKKVRVGIQKHPCIVGTKAILSRKKIKYLL